MDKLLEHHSKLLLCAVVLAPLIVALPSLIASLRNIPDRNKIFVLNSAGMVFFSAWFGALAWACTGRQDISYYHMILRNKWRYLGMAAACAALFVIGGYYLGGKVYAAVVEPHYGDFSQEPVTLGPIAQEITASGRLRPLKVVQVSSQVSGAVLSVGVEVNDVVRVGDVIARIDPASYEARLQQAMAQLARARAASADAAAAGGRARANYAMAESNAVRKGVLFGRGFVTRADLESASAGLADGKAQMGQSSASAEAASAMVLQAESELRAAKLDLERTYIRSPVNGTVLARRVEPGQTVVSNFQTTTLFEIAEDLTRMRVEAQVDEADIGGVQLGQAASFTVDSFPDETFRGRVVAIHKSPEEIQGAIFYPVWIEVANVGQRLLAGMTADVRITQMQKHAALRVPSAALSFELGGPPVGPGSKVYRLVRGRPQPVSVKIGLRSDRWAEVLQSPLRPGDRVIVAAKEPSE